MIKKNDLHKVIEARCNKKYSSLVLILSDARVSGAFPSSDPDLITPLISSTYYSTYFYILANSLLHLIDRDHHHLISNQNNSSAHNPSREHNGS